MEATAGVAAATTARGASLQMQSSSRKEWRAVADHHSARNPGDEVVIRRRDDLHCLTFVFERLVDHMKRNAMKSGTFPLLEIEKTRTFCSIPMFEL